MTIICTSAWSGARTELDELIQGAVERVFRALDLPRRSDVAALNANLERVADALEGLGRRTGDAADAENLRVVAKRIGRAVAKGKCTLRVDVNGGWSAEETPDRVADLAHHGVCVVEQPVTAPAEALVELAGRCALPLMADESLITPADARTLAAAPKGPSADRSIWANVRLSKNGGLWPSMEIAEILVAAEVPLVVGCMVGESSILSAAQRRLLWFSALPRFVEGNYGRFLLRDDLTPPRDHLPICSACRRFDGKLQAVGDRPARRVLPLAGQVDDQVALGVGSP